MAIVSERLHLLNRGISMVTYDSVDVIEALRGNIVIGQSVAVHQFANPWTALAS